MPPAARRQLYPRTDRDISTFYPIIFPILGALLFVGALLWGYCFAHWRHRLSSRKRKASTASRIDIHPAVRGAQFRYVFPRHPELNTDREDRIIKQVGAPRQTPVSRQEGHASQFLVPPRRMPYLNMGSSSPPRSEPSPEKRCKTSLSGSSSKELVLVNKCKEQAIQKPCKALIASEGPEPSIQVRSSTGLHITARKLPTVSGLAKRPSQPLTPKRSEKSVNVVTPHTSHVVQNRFDTPSSWSPSLETSSLDQSHTSVSSSMPKHPLRCVLSKTTLRRNASKLVPSRQPKGPFHCGSKQTSIVAQNMIASPSPTRRPTSGRIVPVAFRPVSGKF